MMRTHDTLLSSLCAFSYHRLPIWWKPGVLEEKAGLARLLVVSWWCDSERVPLVSPCFWHAFPWCPAGTDSSAEGERACLSPFESLICSFFTPGFRFIESFLFSFSKEEMVGVLDLTARTHLLLTLTARGGSRIAHTALVHRMSVAMLTSEVSVVYGRLDSLSRLFEWTLYLTRVSELYLFSVFAVIWGYKQ